MFSIAFLVWLFNEPFLDDPSYKWGYNDLIFVGTLVLDGLLLWGIFNAG